MAGPGGWPASPCRPPRSPAAPADVADVSPGDAWLLGSTYDVTQNVLGSFVDHWNGHRWQSVTLPAALHLGSGTTLTAIGAHGPRDVWIAWDRPRGLAVQPAHEDRSPALGSRSWRRLAQPGSGLGYYNSVQGVRVVSATSAWVVGWDKLGPNEDEKRLPAGAALDPARRWTTTRMPAPRGELDNVTVADGQVVASGDTFSPDQTSLRPGPAGAGPAGPGCTRRCPPPGRGPWAGSRVSPAAGLGDRLHRRQPPVRRATPPSSR